MTLVLHGTPGSKPSPLLRQRVLLILEELGLATPGHIRRCYRMKYQEGIGWNTVVRHLRVLVDTGVAVEQVATTGQTRNTVLFQLAR